MKYRDSASYGRRQEYIAVSELLKRDFDVYMTLVDDQGIDCIIRINENRYLDVQISTICGRTVMLENNESRSCTNLSSFNSDNRA